MSKNQSYYDEWDSSECHVPLQQLDVTFLPLEVMSYHSHLRKYLKIHMFTIQKFI